MTSQWAEEWRGWLDTQLEKAQHFLPEADNLSMLVPAVTTFAVVWLTTIAYNFTQQKRDPAADEATAVNGEGQSMKRKSGKSSSSSSSSSSMMKKHLNRDLSGFIHRSSLLDTGTDIMRAWGPDNTGGTALRSSLYRGWVTMAWLFGLAWILRTLWVNYRRHQTLVKHTGFLKSLLEPFHELILAVLVLYFAMYLAFIIQLIMVKYTFPLDLIHNVNEHQNGKHKDKNKSSISTENYLQSNRYFRARMIRLVLSITQHICQAIMMLGMCLFLFLKCQEWPFTQKLALVIEVMVVYMKMHSYLSMNNKLYRLKMSHLFDEKMLHSERYQLDQKRMVELKKRMERNQITTSELAGELKRRGVHLSDKPLIHGHYGDEKELSMMLSWILEAEEVKRVIYPLNINFWNFLMFTLMPTLVYEPIYPRNHHHSQSSLSSSSKVNGNVTNVTNGINVAYILERIFLGLGVLMSMWLILEEYLLPSVSSLSNDQDKYYQSPLEMVIDLLFPVCLLIILGFLFVWDCLLNTMSEITSFADREFYTDWWNSTTFMQFSRRWNIPVHKFLYRHIYLEFGLYYCGEYGGKMLTFLFSIALHEVALTAATPQFHPWFTFFALFQIPLMPVMNSPVFKHRPLGNIVFWMGIMLGVPLIFVLYARDYCKLTHCTSLPNSHH